MPTSLTELDAGANHQFGEPTKFEVLQDGKRYAPKAVVGLACRFLLGRVLLPNEFSGGEAPGQANYALRRLGFTVLRKGQDDSEEENQARRNWSPKEVFLVIEDYFAMLRKDLLGESYNKTEHRTALRRRLSARSDPSVEYKYRNISAVLAGMGLPYIAGYKPASNYQNLLIRGIEAFLEENPAYVDQLSETPGVDTPESSHSPLTDPIDRFDEPPEFVPIPEPGRPWLTRRLTGVLTLLLGAAYAVLSGQLILAGVSWAKQAHGDPWGPVASLFGIGPPHAIVLGVVLLPLGLLGLTAGWGVLRRRRWAHALAFILAAMPLLLGLVWVSRGDGDAADLALGSSQILYAVFTAVVLIRNGTEFSRSTQPAL